MNDEKRARAKELRDKLQSDVVALITEKLQAGEMTQERSKKIAQMVLEKLPEGINYDELMQIVPKLDDEFAELADVVVPIMVEYEKKIHQILENRVMRLVKEQKFKEAILEARKAMEIEKKLS